MDRTEIAEETARLIYQLEDLLDQTLNKSGELVAHLPAARQAAGLSAVFGQDVFERASRVVTHLVDARRAVVDTHNGCEAVRRKLGISMCVQGRDKPPFAHLQNVQVINNDLAA